MYIADPDDVVCQLPHLKVNDPTPRGWERVGAGESAQVQALARVLKRLDALERRVSQTDPQNPMDPMDPQIWGYRFVNCRTETGADNFVLSEIMYDACATDDGGTVFLSFTPTLAADNFQAMCDMGDEIHMAFTMPTMDESDFPD